MREIKFRGWDKTSKKMVNWNELLDMNLKNIFIMQEKDTGIVLMKYTGLHDKNGKEIYEGDIVKIQDELCIVEYNYNAFCLKVIDQTKPYGWVDFLVYKCEVIGNIYENADLLNN